MTTYTQAQMLALWRSRLGYDDRRFDCTVEQYDGIDVDSIITRAMRAWYLRLLDSAPLHLLPVRRVATAASASIGASLARIDIPGTRRVARIEASRWNAPARIIDPDTATAAFSRLTSPYSTVSPSTPVATIIGDAVYTAPLEPGDAVAVYGVADPGSDSYTLDDALLDTIPSTLDMP